MEQKPTPKKKTIKIKSFNIENVDIEAYMEEYDIETKEDAIELIRQSCISMIETQLELIGVK